MNISSTPSSNGIDPTTDASRKQTQADFKAIGSALQSGDLTGAQQALAQLQKDNPRLAQALSDSSSSSDNPRIAGLKTLASDLQSGKLAAAQQDFAKLQQNAPAAGAHHHHHHHTEAADSTASSTANSSGTGGTGSVLNASV